MHYNIRIAGEIEIECVGGVLMTTRERILVIRLLDKINANPAVAKKLGIVWESRSEGFEDQANPGTEQTCM